jgi:Protein of unknown function VcgC/VcgE (DUF2780)
MRQPKKQFLIAYVAVLFCGLFVVASGLAQTSATPATTSGSGLVSQLSKGLSITRPQASGGAGALFALAKTRLSPDEFSKVSSAVPNMSSLLKAAPAPSENSGLSSLESALPGNMGRTAEAAEAFHKLGLSPEMAGKFLPIMSKYVEARGGSSTAALLEKALK